MRTREFEVVVVGAGPAGSHTAYHLARRGHDVALVDENDGPRCDVVCTGIVGGEAYARFDLDREAVRARIRRARFLSPSGVEVPYDPSEPFANVVDRTDFDDALAQRAVRAGATLLRGHAAREVEKRGDGVVVTALTDAGERLLRARALVVATGHQRWLHESSGLGVPDSYVHGVHADLPFTGLEDAELYFGNEIAPGFFAWAVPFGDGTARLGVLVPQGGRGYFRRFLRRPAIRSRLRVPDGRDLDDWLHARLRSRGIVQGAVTPSYSDRVLAVGEAAGQVKTTTAGGIYYGLIGGEICAGVLSDGLRRDLLDRGFLARYEEEWRKALGAEIEAGFELQQVGRELDDREIDLLFRALQEGVAQVVRRVVQFDWHRPALKALFSRSRVRRVLTGGPAAFPRSG